jgi:hypothetical protein
VESDDWRAGAMRTLKGRRHQSLADPLSTLLRIDDEHTNDRPLVREDSISRSSWANMHYRAHDSAAFGN